METTKISASPTTQKVVITTTVCYRRIALCVLSSLLVAIPLGFSNGKPWILVALSLISVGNAVQIASYWKMLGQIRKDGPIEIAVAAPPSVGQGPYARFGIALSIFVVTLLSAVAIAWTVMCAMIVPITRHRPETLPLFLILSGVGTLIWWFAAYCWKRVSKEIRQPRHVAVPVTVNASEPTLLLPALSQQNQPTSCHWWTDTSTREEITQRQGISPR